MLLELQQQQRKRESLLSLNSCRTLLPSVQEQMTGKSDLIIIWYSPTFTFPDYGFFIYRRDHVDPSFGPEPPLPVKIFFTIILTLSESLRFYRLEKTHWNAFQSIFPQPRPDAETS